MHNHVMLVDFMLLIIMIESKIS